MYTLFLLLLLFKSLFIPSVIKLLLPHNYCHCFLVVLFQLHESFSKVCRQQQVAAVDQGEFLSMCGLVEAKGIMSLKKAKDTRNTKVTLKLDEKELEIALQDKTLVSAVLSKGLPC